MSTFDDSFRERSMPRLLARFGSACERWPGGDHAAKLDEVWMIDWQHEQGDNSGLADKLTVDRQGRTADMYVVLVGEPEIAVSGTDKFRFVHPATGANVVANADRRIGSGPMQSWLCIIPAGIDTKHARVRP